MVCIFKGVNANAAVKGLKINPALVKGHSTLWVKVRHPNNSDPVCLDKKNVAK